MSYPDEWEADVERMIADLAAADALPELPIPPAALARSVADMASRRFIADRIFASTGFPVPGSWGEALWTARDLLPAIAVPLVG